MQIYLTPYAYQCGHAYFPRARTKGLFSPRSLSLTHSLFLFSFFFEIRGAKRRDIIVHPATRTPETHPLAENARQDVCMAENVRRIAATAGLTRELASINAFRIRFFAYCQACITPFRRSAGAARRERFVNMQDGHVRVRSCGKKSAVYCG